MDWEGMRFVCFLGGVTSVGKNIKIETLETVGLIQNYFTPFNLPHLLNIGVQCQACYRSCNPCKCNENS
jgi:hypothetical protein